MLKDVEINILEKLIYASELDPSMPKFPVTRNYPFKVEGFNDVWIKDESTNETGTHKDRMAWEIVMAYKDILENNKSENENVSLPQFSIISAGSAALAIQNQLNRYNLPPLKSLVDKSASSKIISYLESIGVIIYKTDLSKKLLNSKEILKLTENESGFDLTSNKGFNPTARFYDWLSYEILNLNPEYVFVPFGTGQLFENLLETMKNVAMGKFSDVYKGDPAAIKKMHIIGGTSTNPDTKAVKLYAPFRPFSSVNPEWVRLYSARGWCGSETRVIEFEENNLIIAHRNMNDKEVPAEYSAAGGYAALLEIRERLSSNSRIVIINTGKAKFPFLE